jgi:hypothetical protein
MTDLPPLSPLQAMAAAFARGLGPRRDWTRPAIRERTLRAVGKGAVSAAPPPDDAPPAESAPGGQTKREQTTGTEK